MMLTGMWTLTVLIVNKLRAMFYETDIIMTSKGSVLNHHLRLNQVKTKKMPGPLYNSNIRALRSAYIAVNKIAATWRDHNHSHFHLTDEEMTAGCRLGFDSYADACCVGRHARVESFIEGKTVTATGFSGTMPAIENLPLANVLYAYNYPHSEVFKLRVKNSIYLGDEMEDSLLCPNQCRERGIEIDTRPRIYSNNENAQTVNCLEHNVRFEIRHHGPLPFLQYKGQQWKKP